jgi:thiaminase/transcriptional activator TenA
MFVTEGVYLDWGERLRDAHPEDSGNPFGRFYRGWIELHTNETLGPIVNHLSGVVDSASDAEKPRLQSIFDRCARYEIAFWRMAYDGEEWPV